MNKKLKQQENIQRNLFNLHEPKLHKATLLYRFESKLTKSKRRKSPQFCATAYSLLNGKLEKPRN